MALTVVKHPTGHKIIDQAIAAAITDSSGDALITFPTHGLTTADTIYITSDIDEYNGFWYVTTINANTFKISEYEDADFVEYFQDLDIEYYQTDPHDWNSVFLPIVYKLHNTRWPVNTSSTVRTISSFSDDNGYTHIIASGPISITLEVLDYVVISGSSDDINGPYQIVEKFGTLDFVIDLPFRASNDLNGNNIQLYLNNYQVGIKIYAGLPAAHPWQAKKPFVEVAQLSLTPDEDNIVMFSVADYIKSKVAIKNNITLFSLPLNLDAFTGFYIAFNESYDKGDGYTIGREETEYADDEFEGYAVAGKLPFKNTYSGDYADYVYTDGSPAMWLTVMERLLSVEDKYFDISFIKNILGSFSLIIDKYASDYLTETELVSYSDQGIGVYRIPITPDSAYDSFCVRISVESVPVVLDLEDFEQTTSSDVNWTLGAAPTVSLFNTIPSTTTSEDLYLAFAAVAGVTYNINVNFTTIDVALSNFRAGFLTAGFVIDVSDSNPVLSMGTHNQVFSVVATANSVYVFLQGRNNQNGTLGVTVNSVSVAEVGLTDLTQEICIDILESCEIQEGFVPTDIRLLEDGSYRLLE